MLIANRYEPTGVMAWGGMAEVHTCVDHHLSRNAMLKRVKKPEDFHRLSDELKSLLKVRSVHVVELLDIVEYDYAGATEKGLILEFIDGQDLSEGGFTFGADYLFALWQIASGISDIHSHNVIHRDIKPANVRRTLSGVLKIIDFGLARELHVDDKTKSVIGSFGYIAPELTGSGEKKFTKAVDVYAFGATAIGLIRPTAQQRGPLNAALVEDVLAAADLDLRNIIAQCLSATPDARPAISTVRDLLKRKLLRDKHRAYVTINGALTEVNAKGRVGTIKAGTNAIQIEYDGYDFTVKSVSGSVVVNNRAISVGDTMNSSCLLTFGDPSGTRAFVPFDVSNPEISA